MGGFIDEYELFRRLKPKAAVVPVISTGGATLDVAERAGELSAELADERDYIALFHRQLGISVRKERYRDPRDQPAETEKRYWWRRDRT